MSYEISDDFAKVLVTGLALRAYVVSPCSEYERDHAVLVRTDHSATWGTDARRATLLSTITARRCISRDVSSATMSTCASRAGTVRANRAVTAVGSRRSA